MPGAILSVSNPGITRHLPRGAYDIVTSVARNTSPETNGHLAPARGCAGREREQQRLSRPAFNVGVRSMATGANEAAMRGLCRRQGGLSPHESAHEFSELVKAGVIEHQPTQN